MPENAPLADPKAPASTDANNANAAPNGKPANGNDISKNGNGQDKKPKPGWGKPVMIGVVILLVLFGILWGPGYLHHMQTHPSTDDAYVSGNLIAVSPVISGTLQQLEVDEGTFVRRGQLIARIDDAGPRASLRQALANYNAALSQIPQAQRNLIYQQQATQAAIQRAQASLEAQQAKTVGAEQQVTLASGTTQNQVKQAEAQIDQATALVQQSLAQVQTAQATVGNSQQAVTTALASLESYQQQIQTAQKALQAAQARVQAAQIEADRTSRDETRYRALYTQDAVSAQVYDNAQATARNAQANLQAAQAQAEEAQSQVEQAHTGVKQAQSQVEQARKNVTQGEAQVRAAQRATDAAREQVRVQRAGLGLARANGTQVGIQRANLAQTAHQTGESEADIATARAGQEQVEVRRKQIETYRAQAEQAKAALTNAQITLNDTLIYAPTDGTIVRKSVNVGASLSPGQSIVTMTQGDYVWVEANFKETQLGNVVPGEPVEIEVDAFPHKIFKAHVHSINEATGAATSLLPPDNSTGNFTKVVQRIPVRIELEAANDNEDKRYARQSDILNLRQGMSVVTTIDTTDVDKYRRQQKPPRPASQTVGTAAGAGGGR